MDILITHGSLARSRSLHLRTSQIVVAVSLAVLLLIGLSGLVYHYVFMAAARGGWPIVSSLVGVVVKDEIEQRDRFMRENLDAMARKVGEMQAKLVRLESIGERVSGMAGLKSEDLRTMDGGLPPPAGSSKPGKAADAGAGRGGPFHPTSLDELNQLIAQLDAQADHHSDVFTLVESRLLERRLTALVVPSMAPVNGPIGSTFGFRIDPFNGRPALHTGLDYPAGVGTQIRAAAGGMIRAAEVEAAYGMAVEVDHGNGLTTRYAHTSKVMVKPGDLVKRGDVIALVGNTGRSTGPHLHFEVLLDGVPQNPQRFLGRAGQVDLGEGAVGHEHARAADISTARNQVSKRRAAPRAAVTPPATSPEPAAAAEPAGQ